MKYEQPYGISDPNASYINGNPSTGTMGSIPPAASIENPQREIVNFINVSALTPTDADLFQLAKAVQAGLVNYGADQGTPNQIAITPSVPISGYALGQRFVIKVKYGNTSQVTINVDGRGGVPLIHTDLSPMNPYELIVGQLIEVAYDGANFQAIGGVGIGGSVLMTAPQTLYVNVNTGSDTLYDGTSATISGQSGPFKTIQKALATMRKYNLGGWNFTIRVADGVYTNTSLIDLPLPNGSGGVTLIGNSANPLAVSIFNTSSGSCIRSLTGGGYWLEGFSFRATASNAGDQGHSLWWQGAGSNLTLTHCDFNTAPSCHLSVGMGAAATVYGDCTISGGAGGAHYNAVGNGTIINGINPGPNITITAPVTLGGGFAAAGGGGYIYTAFNQIVGAGNVTGNKYVATGNGVVDTKGAGASYLPGSAAGILQTGGQYL